MARMGTYIRMKFLCTTLSAEIPSSQQSLDSEVKSAEQKQIAGRERESRQG